jgi:hypothetical protein
MNIELSDEEAQLLREILDSVVSDLSPEIADTDNPDYRRSLIDRRTHLRAILAKFGASPSA